MKEFTELTRKAVGPTWTLICTEINSVSLCIFKFYRIHCIYIFNVVALTSCVHNDRKPFTIHALCSKRIIGTVVEWFGDDDEQRQSCTV